MKVCRSCQNLKPLSDYYKHSQMFDGHLNKCKECVKKRVSLYSKTPAGKAVERKRQKTKKRRDWQVKYMRKRRKLEPLKYEARTAVNNAIRDGRLSKGVCEVCGSSNTQAHHEDYTKPLDIIWLCFPCHKKAHQNK